MAGSGYSCQAAAVSSLVAIRGTWQRRRMKLMNIYDSLKTYLLFTQTNRVEGVRVRDWAITPADWSSDVAELTGKVNETKHGWTNSTVRPDPCTKARSRSTHQLTYMCTTLHQHAAAHMDDWAWFLVWMLLWMRSHSLCCQAKLLYQTLPGGRHKDK